jgi:uncharacterized repeat protein (TIGR03837 family)
MIAWRAAHAPLAAHAASAISDPCDASERQYTRSATLDLAVLLRAPGPARLLAQCTKTPTHLLVTPGRAKAVYKAVGHLFNENGCQPLMDKRDQLSISYLPHCTQPAFDDMLWACDLNLVRGEDSLVRALWAGQALVWQIYPQHDNAHHDKLMAFLDWLKAPALAAAVSRCLERAGQRTRW